MLKVLPRSFVGVNPKPKQSGSSINGVGRISKTGDSDLRKAFLYACYSFS